MRDAKGRPAGEDRRGAGGLLGRRAELGGCFGRQVVGAEADRRHQCEVLLAADEVLQLGVERLVEVGVFLAEGDRAMADHGLAGNLAERLGRFDALVLRRHVGDRQRSQRGGVGAPGLHGSDQARLVRQLHDLLLGDAGIARVSGLDSAGHDGELEAESAAIEP